MNQGDKIKKILRQYRVTQQDLADKMGKERTQVTRMLGHSIIEQALKQTIAEAIDVSIEELELQLSDDSIAIASYKELESKVGLLEELRDSLKRENQQNEKLIKMQEQKIEELQSKLEGSRNKT